MSPRLKVLPILLLAGLAACSSSTTGSDGGYLSWSPAGLWLTAPAGGQAQGDITVTNSGSQPATIGSVEVTAASRPVFTVYYTGGLVVDVDAGIEISVVYAPPSCLDGGDDTADVSFASDSSDAPTYSVPLVGICTPAIPDAGVDAGEDAGLEDAGVDGGEDAGLDAGVDAGWVDAGTDAGFDAGQVIGSDAGSDAGSDGGVDGGPDGGLDAGNDAGVDGGPDAGVDAGAVEDAGPDAG